MRVLVCGSRTFNDFPLLDKTLTEWYEKQGVEATLVHGAARGADLLAEQWALMNSVPIERYPADWSKYGRAAGPIRNQQMLDTGIDVVIAFPIGEARGTRHMMKIARKAGVEVIEVG